MTALPHLMSPTLGDQAYDAVRQAIVSGDLARGLKVTERGLAESLNISPTPVREALRRLEQDRLVVRTGPRAVQIAQFDDQELRTITMIENTLRALAARLAAEMATEPQIEAMRAALMQAESIGATLKDDPASLGVDSSSDDLDAIKAALRVFHGAVDSACGSPTLIHMLRMVDAFNYEERRATLVSQLSSEPEAVAERFNQHRLIFQAIVRRDPDEAERLMMLHSHDSNERQLAARHTD